jgi:RNA polymerase sigma factor (sigma-70 family)
MTAIDPDDVFRRFLRTGDPEAFARLYDAARPELLRTATRHAPDAATAEDLVQATFLGALESSLRFRHGGKVMPWLHGILKNQVRLMRWRQSRKPDAGRLAWPEVADPGEQAEERELVAKVTAALDGLGAVYGPVMRLHLHDEQSANEIARRTDRPAGTVRTQIVRGTAMLQKLLPPGIATMLLVRSTPGLGPVEVRRELVARAATGLLPRAWWSTMPLRAVVLSLCAAAGVVLAVLVATRAAGGGPPAMAGGASAVGAPTVAGAVAEAADAPAASGNGRRMIADRIDRTVLEVVVTSRATPVAGVPVELIPFADVRFDRRLRATDTDGRARFDDVMPGRYLVLPIATDGDRTSGIVELPARGSITHRVEVAGLVTVAGRTVDGAGFAVAGATVWLSDGDFGSMSSSGAMPFGRSDAAGRFSLLVYPRMNRSHAQATAPGREASPLQRVPAAAGQDLVLVLGGAGAGVEGTVSGADGRPCADVLVRATLAGERSNLVVVGPDGSQHGVDDFGAVREVRTTADGRFSIDGFALGRPIRLVAWSREHARHERTVLAGTGEHLQVVLERGATIRGRVRTDGASPGAIEVSTTEDRDDGRLRCMVRTDDSGAFVLSGITPGELVTLVAESPPPPLGTGAGKVSTQLRLEPGRLYEWNPALEAPDGVTAGTVRSSTGEALAGWYVDMVAIDVREGRNNYTTKTDANGRYSMAGLPKSRYWLTPRARGGSNAIQYVLTWPLQDDYEFVVPEERVQAARQGHMAATSDSLPRGRLDVRGVDPRDYVWLSIVRPGGDAIGVDVAWDAQRKVQTCELPTGRYQLVVSSNSWSTEKLTTADHVIEFTIVGGTPTTIEPELQPGVRRIFRIEEPSPHVQAGSAQAVVYDVYGNVVTRSYVPRWFETDPSRFEATVALAPGRYRIEVTTDIGQVGSVDFAIDALQPDPTVVPLRVR